jgi:hypothetical protein
MGFPIKSWIQKFESRPDLKNVTRGRFTVSDYVVEYRDICRAGALTRANTGEQEEPIRT